MLKKLTQHPKEQGETYFQHMLAAWKVVYMLKIIELKCLVHSILPFLFVDAVSSKIDCLHKLTKRNAPNTDEELYEVYGGD